MDNAKFYQNFFEKYKNKHEDDLKRQTYSLLVCLILDLNLFTSNKELHLLLDKLNLNRALKDYLFASRTQLLARLIREFQIMDRKLMVENLEIIYSYLSNYFEFTKEVSNNSKIEINETKIQNNLRIISKYKRENGEQ